MNDIDRLLSEALNDAGQGYSPRDPVAAREEFESRRRRRFVWQLSGGVALAGAAIVAALFVMSSDPVREGSIDPGPMEAAALDILTRFEVGAEPLAIGAGSDEHLWIASREGDSISRIDLNTGDIETVDLPGANEIVVGAENVWASGENGDYLRINEANPNDVFDGSFVETEGGAQLVDLAVGGDAEGAAWAVDTEGCVWELTEPRNVVCAGPGFAPTDVATDTDETWVLDSNAGHVRQENADPGVDEGRPAANYQGLPISPYGDMTMTENVLWVSGGGRIVTIDLATSERRELAIDGDYADLAVGPETVWVLAGWADGDERARVYELSHDLEIIGISDILRGEPSDLVADANGVWITIRHRNEVIYLSRGDTAPPVPPTVEDEEVDHGDVVMVFGKDGDIWAAYADGAFGPLVKTPADEAHPVLVENIYSEGAPAVLFDRTEGGKPTKLAWVDLATMEEYPIAEGWAPASQNTNHAAWLGNSASVPWVVVGELFSDGPREITIEDANNEPVQLRQLAWDRDGRFLYGLTNEASPRVASIDSLGEFEETYSESDPEAHYTAIASGSGQDSVTVIRVCCSAALEPGAVVDSVELGELRGWSGGSVTYHRIADLTDLAWGPDLVTMSLTRADGLSAVPADEETVTWGPSDGPAWIVSDGRRTFLVDETGLLQEIPIDIDAGADVNESRNLR